MTPGDASPRRSADGTSGEGDSQSLERRSLLRWLALSFPLVVPWVVIRTSQTTLVFPWGTLVVETGYFTPIWTFLAQPGPMPDYLQAWPIGVACYAAALGWAGARRFEFDQRVTAGLFVLVAITAVWMASGFGVDPNRTAFPLGSILAIGIAVWVYVVDA